MSEEMCERSGKLLASSCCLFLALASGKAEALGNIGEVMGQVSKRTLPHMPHILSLALRHKAETHTQVRTHLKSPLPHLVRPTG